MAFNEHKDVKDYLTKKEMDQRKELICPMVFFDENTRMNNSTPNTESIDMFYSRMDMIMTACNNSNSSGSSISNLSLTKLYDLSSDNINNVAFSVSRRITNAVYMSVFSAIDQSYINSTGLLNYIPIRYNIKKLFFEDLYKETDCVNDNFQSIIRKFYYGLINIKGSLRKDLNEPLIDSLMSKESTTYIVNYAQNISMYIISRINATIEQTVLNITSNRIDGDSNPDNYFEQLVKEVFKGIDQGDGQLWMYASYAINKALYDEISICYSTIIKDIVSVLMSPDTALAALIYESIIRNIIIDENKNGTNKLNYDEVF